MKIILDNCMHYGTKSLFPDHDALHACDVGWGNLVNGKLIKAAATQFDVLVTTDKGMRFQQNLKKLPLPIIELNTPDTRIDAMQVFATYIPAALAETKTCRFVVVYSDGRIECLGRDS